jgi:hypothetical protein
MIIPRTMLITDIAGGQVMRAKAGIHTAATSNGIFNVNFHQVTAPEIDFEELGEV